MLNTRIPGDYVRNPAQLDILSGVPESLAALSEIFGRMVVVTNQQGIGKGLYAEDDLALVHEKLMQSVRQAGGRIDAVFFVRTFPAILCATAANWLQAWLCRLKAFP